MSEYGMVPGVNLFQIDIEATVKAKALHTDKGENTMKFDCVVMNPPYQNPNGEKDSIWYKFVDMAIDGLINKDGYLCAVHPTGWRFSGSFRETGTRMKERQIQYLELHGNHDGQKAFGVSTCYDWYVLKNCPNHKKTIIRDRNGDKIEINIEKLPFIPNAMIDKVLSLLAKTGEQTVDIMFSYSSYEPRKNWMSDTKDSEHPYPCVYSVNTQNELSLKYSSVNDKGHFGVPKVIIGDGCNFGIFEDKKGEYGMTQWALGIVDDVSNFAHISKALSSKEFQQINRATTTKNTAGIGVADRNILKYFRKDFWREFL